MVNPIGVCAGERGSQSRKQGRKAPNPAAVRLIEAAGQSSPSRNKENRCELWFEVSSKLNSLTVISLSLYE